MIHYERGGEERVSVLYGRCLHRGALMADGRIEGENLICGLHGWDYRYDTGVSEYNNAERLHRFNAWIEEVNGARSVTVDPEEVRAWEERNPQPYRRDEYLGQYADVHGAPEEPHVQLIQSLATDGLEKVARCQAFHFKGGQGAKTGTGGHLPWHKVNERIAEVRGLEVGQAAVSPATFTDLHTPADFRALADEVRGAAGGIPVGFKLSAQHIEDDLDFALEASADYVILDGRGGGTGSAPLIFRDNISVPTIPALARARRLLDEAGRGRGSDAPVTLIITGGLRTPADFAKAMALGADAVAVSNAAIQAIGCLGMRACDSNNCPVGIATQKDHLRARLIVEASAERLRNFFLSAVDLMRLLARACGRDHLSGLSAEDLTTFDREMAHLTGVRYGGVALSRSTGAPDRVRDRARSSSQGDQ